MSFFKIPFHFVAVSVLLAGLTGYSFITAYDESVWFPPESGSIPPQNNVAMPINTSSSSQIKTGNLGIGNTLAFFGWRPRLVFMNLDPAVPRWVQSAEITDTPGVATMKFLYDRDNSGSVWDNSNSATFELSAGATAADDYAKFANQVWANEYCDKTGDNCIDPTDQNGGGADLSAIRTYSTQNNTRNVSGAGCSCDAGDSLTACGGGGTPMIATDPNACMSSNTCTCLSTKPSDGLCAVTIRASITGADPRSVGSSYTPSGVETIQVKKGDLVTIGFWTNNYAAVNDANFSRRLAYAEQDLYSTHTHMGLGYWNETDFTARGAAFIDRFIINANNPLYQWGRRSTLRVLSPGQQIELSERNGWSRCDDFLDRCVYPHTGKITATVGACQ